MYCGVLVNKSRQQLVIHKRFLDSQNPNHAHLHSIFQATKFKFNIAPTRRPRNLQQLRPPTPQGISKMLMVEEEYMEENVMDVRVRHVLSELYDSNIILPPPEVMRGKVIESAGRCGTDIKPGTSLNPEKHFYPNVLHTNIHPIAKIFFSLGNENIVERFMELNPSVNREILLLCLQYTPKYFLWAGSDLFHVRTMKGERKMIIVETNSCPSGQKSMPSKNSDRYSGYRTVLEKSFKYVTQNSDRTLGDLAVIYDKNEMEVQGYASILSEVSKERVWVVEFKENDANPPVKWVHRVMYIRDAHSNWHSIRACFRYVTQKPWSRIPLNSRTLVMNNIIACLCGGRNKAMAAYAYELLNQELTGTGLKIQTPETRVNVLKEDIPRIIEGMGGKGVIKVPYSNAGQGVYTIMNSEDLKEFMGSKQHYEKYLVQSLVEPFAWNSERHHPDQYYHIGTVRNRSHKSYVNDIRMMVCAGEKGFEPVSIYSRRARKHIESIQGDASSSWDMLGTNLSIKTTEDGWGTEANRLILFDRKDFYKLNLNLNDLINGYIQTVLCVIAIDKLCDRCIQPNGEFNYELFKTLNPDKQLLNEIKV